jgi:O-methyltransferase domain
MRVQDANLCDGPAEDTFLRGFIGSQALAVALDKGLIDRLSERPLAAAEIESALGLDRRGTDILLGLLLGEGVVEEFAGAISLAPAFRAVLSRREALEVKIKFLQLAARDVLDHFADLLFDLPTFMARARTFSLFRYDRCVDLTPANITFTRQWVTYTSMLTRYEAQSVLPHIDLGGRRQLLDIGGNSGEFALRLCRRHPDLRATIVDLPVVCAIGEEHVRTEPEAVRIRFVAADARRNSLPGGHDIVSFKSMLHDWPDGDAFGLLERAVAALDPGGLLIIFERSWIDARSGSLPYAMAANLVFAPFFRDPGFYVSALAKLGLTGVRVERILLEMPFHLILAVKPR